MNPETPKFTPGSSLQEREEAAPSPQVIAWEKNRSAIDAVTDSLGLGIDEKIKETVTAFRVHGFITSQSCEGHSGEDEQHGESFPWVEVYAPESPDWEKAQGENKKLLEREWIVQNLKQRQKMTNLLAEFYQSRVTPFDARLAFDRVGAFGGFRVQSFGAEILRLLPPAEQRQKLESYRQEMNDFTEFLKDKYFSNKVPESF